MVFRSKLRIISSLGVIPAGEIISKLPKAEFEQLRKAGAIEEVLDNTAKLREKNNQSASLVQDKQHTEEDDMLM